MSLRSAVATGLNRAATLLSPPGTPTPTPAQMTAAARDTSQMGMGYPLAPGEPISPYDGYNRQPRVHDFPAGINIATRPRSHERVSFDTLRGLITAYDVAQIAIWHRIDTLRGLKWKLLAADRYNGDVTGAITVGMASLRKPDRIHNFRTWFGKWMYDVLAYDAGTLYRLRTPGGKAVGLLPVDGTTIAPLLDYWGNPPQDPAEAYVQYVNGLPWNWLSRSDLIYAPFRAVNNSPYGLAPVETIILNANTDIRFQLHFLQRFTDGNIPQAFASAPDTWSPQQIEQFQEYWDAMMFGDQARKAQIRWMPGGSTIVWSNEKPFTDAFSLFLMRKTCAAFHVVPTDLGFTESSNYSTGESQSDVQHKVGELPLMEFTEEVLSQFLVDDLGLPLKFEFDRGEDQDDRLNQAQADDIYIKNGTISPTDIRSMRYGLEEPGGIPVPRFIYTQRSGPVPLIALEGVAGPVDPQTGAPVVGAPMPHSAFTEVQGVLSNPPVLGEPLAEEEFGAAALPPAPPKQPMPPGAPVSKDAAAGPAAGVTAGTGVYGDPLTHDDDDEDKDSAGGDSGGEVRKELAAFTRFRRARVRAGQWRDFTFTTVPPADAAALNTAGRAAVTKTIEQSKADQVYAQLAGDYPKASLQWVHDAAWEGPRIMPFTQLNMRDRANWRASHEPDRVAGFARKIRKRLKGGKDQLKKPVVVVFEPGRRKAIIVDGHHRTVGAEEAGQPGVLAWVAHTDRRNGPWRELHDLQFTQPTPPVPAAADDMAAEQVGKAADGGAAWLLLRAPNTDGKWRYLLQKRDERTSHGGTWGLPGGKTQPGEQPWDAAVREAAEELGELPDPLTPAAAWNSGDAWTYLVDVPDLFRPDLGGDASHETAGWGWFRRADVAGLPLHPALRKAWARFDFADPDLGGGSVTKAADSPAVTAAGLAVQAADTGRVLMLQRALTDTDAAAGKWEFPGGCLEPGETPLAAAAREWCEETGCILPLSPDAVAALADTSGPSWASGVYQGFVYPVPSESAVPVRSPTQVTNPDDPDGDQVEAIAWWDPTDLVGNPAVRPELLECAADVLAALTPPTPTTGAQGVCPCGLPTIYSPENGWEHTDGSVSHGDGETVTTKMATVTKAGGGDGTPKAPVQQVWPGWDYDLQTVAWWAPLIIAAMLAAINPDDIAAGWLRLRPVSRAGTEEARMRALSARARKWLTRTGVDFTDALTGPVQAVMTDGYAIGASSAQAVAHAGTQLGSVSAAMGDWAPGATQVARELSGQLGDGAGLRDLLDRSGVRIRSIAATRIKELGRTLARGVEDGLPVEDLADLIRGTLSVPERAQMIVATELARAANEAAGWVYRFHGVEQVVWVTADDDRVCVGCAMEEEAGPRALRGAVWPPAHPLCRCALVPAP